MRSGSNVGWDSSQRQTLASATMTTAILAFDPRELAPKRRVVKALKSGSKMLKLVPAYRTGVLETIREWHKF